MAKVIELIKESMKEKKMTQTELAKSLGEDVRVINQQLNRQQDLKAERFLEVMEHIGYRVEMVDNDGMSELTKALLKYRRKFALVRGENVNPTNGDTDLFKARADIIDELADVRIMCRQMELLFQAEDEVEKRIDFKVDRQLKRLEDK